MDKVTRELQEAIYGASYLEGGKLGGIWGDIEEIKERLSKLEKEIKALRDKEESDWMTVRQVTKYLHISKTTFYEWVNKGRIILYKVSEDARAVRVKRSEIDQLFQPIDKVP